MKKMKKLVSSLLIACMVFTMTACAKEQSVTYTTTMEESGLLMTDTITLDAKGDKIETMTEIIEVDMSEFDDATYEQLKVVYDTMAEMYKAVDGVQCTVEEADKVYTLEVVIEATGDVVKELADQGLLAIEGNGDRLSLKATIEGLEGQGYEKAE